MAAAAVEVTCWKWTRRLHIALDSDRRWLRIDRSTCGCNGRRWWSSQAG
jgi:hypothetical protein